MKKVLISIINWNYWQLTIECIESLLKLEYPNFTIIIIDNNSTNDSIEKIEQYLNRNIEPHFPEKEMIQHTVLPVGTHKVPYSIILEEQFTPEYITNCDSKVLIVKNKKNYGFGHGHNQVLHVFAQSSIDGYVWVLNNDVTVEKNSLALLVDELEQNSHVGFTAPLLPFYHEPETLQCYGGSKFYPLLGFGKLFKKNMPVSNIKSINEKEIRNGINYLPATAILVRKELLKQIKGFDPDYFMYTEDIDFSFRTRKAGFIYSIVPKSIVYHMESKSTANKKHTFFYLYTKGNIIFLRKHFSPFFLLTAIPAMLFHTCTMGCSIKNLWYTLKGINAGLTLTLSHMG